MGYMASLFRSCLFTKHDEYCEINYRVRSGKARGRRKPRLVEITVTMLTNKQKQNTEAKKKLSKKSNIESELQGVEAKAHRRRGITLGISDYTVILKSHPTLSALLRSGSLSSKSPPPPACVSLCVHKGVNMHIDVQVPALDTILRPERAGGVVGGHRRKGHLSGTTHTLSRVTFIPVAVKHKSVCAHCHLPSI